jgi:hypothetical protein
LTFHHLVTDPEAYQSTQDALKGCGVDPKRAGKVDGASITSPEVVRNA